MKIYIYSLILTLLIQSCTNSKSSAYYEGANFADNMLNKMGKSYATVNAISTQCRNISIYSIDSNKRRDFINGCLDRLN